MTRWPGQRSAPGNKLRIKHIHLGMFDFAVTVCYGPERQMIRYIAWAHDEHPRTFVEGGAFGRIYIKDGVSPKVWLPRKPKTGREMATLAHECIHAISTMMRWAGMPQTNDSEEVLAHGVTFLMCKALEGEKKR